MNSRRSLIRIEYVIALALVLISTGYHGALSSPAAPLHESLNVGLVGVAEGGRCYSVAISGTTLCAGFYDVFTVLDAANPSILTREANLLLNAVVAGIRISGDYAYVANVGEGLRVIDISTPSHPVEVGNYAAGGDVHELAVSGSYAYLATDTVGLKIVNISSPASPFEVGTCDTPGKARHVVVSGNYAYVADYDSGMRVIDITSPSSPSEVGFIITGGEAVGIDISGDYVYLADKSNGLRAIDVSIKSSPTEVDYYTDADEATGVTIEGSYAYVSDGNDGFRVIDISDPSNLFEVGHFDQYSYAHESVISGNYAYVAENFSGLTVVDISDQSNPFKEESFGGWERLRDIRVVGDYAYMSADSDIIRVADISDITAPLIIGHLPWGITTIYGLDVSGDYAYVGKSTNLLIIDVSSPASPVYCCSYSPAPGGAVRSMEIHGNLMYTTIASFGLRIVEMLTPTSLSDRGYAFTVGPAYDVSVSGQYAYLLDGSPGRGLRVIDVSDYVSLVEVGSYNTSGVARAIALSGDYAYIADYGSGLKIIDISTPSAPTKTGEYVSPYTGAAVDVAITTYDFVYLADEAGGVRVIDVSNKSLPVEVGYFQKTGEITSVTAVDDLIYLVDRSTGLLILENSLHPTSVDDRQPYASITLYQNYPNPFNPSTTIRFYLPESSPVTLDIYDISGRRVACLVDKVLEKGFHTTSWNGTDRRGGPVGSGVYFSRLVSGEETISKKIILLK